MRQLVQPFSSSGGSCLPSITSHMGFATHHFTAVFCSRPNGNGPTGDKAVLSLCFKVRGEKNKSLQHSSVGLHWKLKGKVFRQRLAAPLLLRGSLCYRELHTRQKDAELHKFKLGNNKVKGTPRLLKSVTMLL